MMNRRALLKIVLTGPESSGKTTLAKALAAHYQTVWVPEYARNYLEPLGLDYQEEDLLHIAKGQLDLEEQFANQSKGLLFCDTGLIVLKIWSEYRFGRCHPWILEQLQHRHYDLYLLCSPDIPWHYDPLRQNALDRELLFELYPKEMEQKKQ